MAKMYKGAGAKARVMVAARKGTHHGALMASRSEQIFTIGIRVRVIATGVEADIIGVESWGDYILEGLEGSFTPKRIERVTPR